MRVVAIVVGVFMLGAAACSGGDASPPAPTAAAVAAEDETSDVGAEPAASGESATTGEATVPTTSPANTAPSTAPTTTAPPTTLETTSPSTTDQVDLGSSAAYCSVATDLYIIEAAGDAADEISPTLLETLMGFFAVTATDLQTLAPDDELAQQATQLLGLLAIFDEIAAEGGYDFETLEASPRIEELAAVADDIDVLLESNELYLSDVCGTSLADLEGEGAELLAMIETEGEGFGAGLVGISDESGRIRVSAPGDWAVDGRPAVDAIRLIVASDLERFSSSWVVPGFVITAWDVEPGAADAAARADATATTSACEVVSTELYDDVLYVGELTYYTSCDGEIVNAFVLAVTNFESDIEIVIEARFNDPHSAVPRAIFDSFLVDVPS